MHLTIVDCNDSNLSWYKDNLGKSLKLKLLKNIEALFPFSIENRPDVILIELASIYKNYKKSLMLLKNLIGDQIPIMVTSSKPTEKEVVECLKLGVDDFIGRPITLNELKARIENRWAKFTPKISHDLPEIQIDSFTRKAYLANSYLPLHLMDFSILYLLIKNSGITVTRDTIMKDIHGRDWRVMDRGIDNAVARIRKIIGCKKVGCNSKNPKYIRSIRGIGYMFIGKGRILEKTDLVS